MHEVRRLAAEEFEGSDSLVELVVLPERKREGAWGACELVAQVAVSEATQAALAGESAVALCANLPVAGKKATPFLMGTHAMTCQSRRIPRGNAMRAKSRLSPYLPIINSVSVGHRYLGGAWSADRLCSAITPARNSATVAAIISLPAREV